MAAPADVSMTTLSGEWELNAKLSDPTDSILVLQGMGWALRKVLSRATITLHVHQYRDPKIPTLYQIDTKQVITGGISGNTEHLTLDWKEREHIDNVFGLMNVRSRMLYGLKVEGDWVRPTVEVYTKVGRPIADAEAKRFMQGEILKDRSQSNGFVAENAETAVGEGELLFMQSFAKNSKAEWTAEQVWGFEVIDGERRYTQRVVVAKNGKVEMARLVYNFKNGSHKV